MPAYPRYAIYYVPAPASPFYRYGAALIGYDAFDGQALCFPGDIVDAIPDWSDLTRDPRKYGFHATLKAPFSLASGRTRAELVESLESFARLPRAIPVITPLVGTIDRFVAVVPATRSVEIETLAQDCVVAFDRFRAPLTAEDRAQRNPQMLTERQLERLDRWGYPYVMEDFRFHMTLTGRLAADRCDDIVAMLGDRFSTLALAALPIDRVALLCQANAASGFTIVKHAALVSTSPGRRGSL